VNLKIGTSYLKLVLDDFAGSQALAAAAYHAGPSRPRRWREGATLEPAIWAENIPFTETRDYVKKVLSNATVYAVLLSGQRQSPPALPPPVATAASAMPEAASVPAAAAASTAAAIASDSASAPAATAQLDPPTPPLLLLPSLKTRLGTMIGPRAASAPPMDNELP
jgi:hypothetical protein